MSIAAENRALNAPSYLSALVAYFRRADAELWNWFASHSVQEEHLAAVRLELLKSAYRIERGDQPELYAAAQRAAEAIGVTAAITLYQAQGSQQLNASLAFLPGEVHLVLHGPVAQTLSEPELLAVLGHELSHYRLLSEGDGQFSICLELLRALAHSKSDAASSVSLRLFDLYSEIYCDRGGWLACQDLHAAVAALVKLETGVKEVRAESYLQQATEIMAHAAPRAQGATHPESYLRARSLQLWHEQGAEAEAQIDAWLQGAASLEELDLLGQQRVAEATRRLIDAMLAPEWMQTDPSLAHARMFFADYVPPVEAPSDEELKHELAAEDAALRDYYAYVLLDFATADAELDELPLAQALRTARAAGFETRLVELAVQELRLKKKQAEQLQQQVEKILAGAARRPPADKKRGAD